MSIINDALKKVEKQRTFADDAKVRVLNDISAMPRASRGATRRWFFWSGTTLIYVLSLYLFFSPNPLSLQNVKSPVEERQVIVNPVLPQTVLNLRKIDFELPAVKPSDYTLSGIVYDQTRPLAIINKRIVSEGSLVDGARLLEIKPSYVRLSYQDTEFNLKVK